MVRSETKNIWVETIVLSINQQKLLKNIKKKSQISTNHSKKRLN